MFSSNERGGNSALNQRKSVKKIANVNGKDSHFLNNSTC